MSDNHFENLLENEKEWRRHLLKEVGDIKKELSNLRIKVAVIGSFFGLIGAYIKTKLF